MKKLVATLLLLGAASCLNAQNSSFFGGATSSGRPTAPAPTSPLVQTAYYFDNSVGKNNPTATLKSPTTVGNLLVVVTLGGFGIASVPTDNGGNIYTLCAGCQDGTTTNAAYLAPVTAASTIITDNVPSGPSFRVYELHRVTGLDGHPPSMTQVTAIALRITHLWQLHTVATSLYAMQRSMR
jgi:hypothetical protein